MSKVHYNEPREELYEDIFLGIDFLGIIFAIFSVTRLAYKSLPKKRMEIQFCDVSYILSLNVIND